MAKERVLPGPLMKVRGRAAQAGKENGEKTLLSPSRFALDRRLRDKPDYHVLRRHATDVRVQTWIPLGNNDTHILTLDLQPMRQIISTEVRHIMCKATLSALAILHYRPKGRKQCRNWTFTVFEAEIVRIAIRLTER